MQLSTIDKLILGTVIGMLLVLIPLLFFLLGVESVPEPIKSALELL